MKKLILICLFISSLFSTQNFNEYEDKILLDVKNQEDDFFINAGFKNYIIKEEKNNTKVIVNFSNINKYNKVGKQIVLKSFAVSFIYTHLHNKLKCTNLTNIMDKMQCFKKIGKYTFKKNIIFQTEGFKISGTNLKKDFYLTASDEKKMSLKNWYLK